MRKIWPGISERLFKTTCLQSARMSVLSLEVTMQVPVLRGGTFSSVNRAARYLQGNSTHFRNPGHCSWNLAAMCHLILLWQRKSRSHLMPVDVKAQEQSFAQSTLSYEDQHPRRLHLRYRDLQCPLHHHRLLLLPVGTLLTKGVYVLVWTSAKCLAAHRIYAWLVVQKNHVVLIEVVQGGEFSTSGGISAAYRSF